MLRDFIEGTLLPLIGLRKPENASGLVQGRTLAAERFLTADLDEPVHALHSCSVEPFPKTP
jgi:hypothetical protein